MLRVGVHPNNLHLRILHLLDAGPSGAVFVPYPEGRDTGRWLAERRIDVGGTGSTPPVIDAARGLPCVYLAASMPRPANGALLVPARSSVRSIEDLVGARIALVEGSFHTALLAGLAERVGLRLPAFERVDLAPEAARQAIRAGSVDAWIAMDPHLGIERRLSELRELEGCAGVVPNRSVFWTLGDRLRPLGAAIDALLERLEGLHARIAAETKPLAALLAQGGDADESAWRHVLATRDWRVRRADATLLDEQRAEAALLARHGAIATEIATAEVGRIDADRAGPVAADHRDSTGANLRGGGPERAEADHAAIRLRSAPTEDPHP